jgi:hypothetical protein
VPASPAIRRWIGGGIRRRAARREQPASRRAVDRAALLPASTPVIYYGDEIGMGDNIYLGAATACGRRCNGRRSQRRLLAIPRDCSRRQCRIGLRLPAISVSPGRHPFAPELDEAGRVASSSASVFRRGSLEFSHNWHNRKILAFPPPDGRIDHGRGKPPRAVPKPLGSILPRPLK